MYTMATRVGMTTEESNLLKPTTTTTETGFAEPEQMETEFTLGGFRARAGPSKLVLLKLVLDLSCWCKLSHLKTP